MLFPAPCMTDASRKSDLALGWTNQDFVTSRVFFKHCNVAIFVVN